ncbi:MAG: hypothetical protein JXR19_05840 [Bacteroidia bacterium]
MGWRIGLLALVIIGYLELLARPSVSFEIDPPKLDSTSLSKDSIFICEEHFFEWCKDSAYCSYDYEPLKRVDLWSYYKLLECEECQEFFIENLENFQSE